MIRWGTMPFVKRRRMAADRDREVSAELAVLISAALVAEQAVLTSAIFSICLAEVGEGAEMVRNRGRIFAMTWKLLFVRRPVVFIRPLL